MHAQDIAAFRSRENALWREEARFDRTCMDEVLHPEFVEFGRSGHTHTRAQVLGADPVPIAVELREFAAHAVAEGVVLVTYRTVDPDGQLLGKRSSLWVRHQGSWRLRFHQGTPSTVDS